MVSAFGSFAIVLLVLFLIIIFLANAYKKVQRRIPGYRNYGMENVSLERLQKEQPG
ncbi:uncharacterized protein Dana_GF27239 [Drosophila ananassae]|uniref:Uncharacterized protein n=1 Tax=Drosophila ananassae TaxID=7217 RepID=A0A0P9AH87_DROAN|nr:uncharacterized protein Dana_GF27239 [Drosophila ananassae]